MGRKQPVPVAGSTYTDDCLPWASMDTVNYITVKAEKEGTRSPAFLRCLPGCTTFSVTGSNAPVRGARDVEGKLLVVSGNALYRIGTDGLATSLGTIPGTGRVSMTHNQIAGGNEVVIGNGQAGYVYNTATETLAQITDEGFPGAKVVGFIDGYVMFVEPQGRYWGWSDLAAGTSYSSLDRSEAEAQPDRIVSGIESHGEWMVLGERTTEFYRNTGATTGTFQRIDGTNMEIGCAGTHTVAKMDNSVYWVGHDRILYRLNGGGYQAERVSDHAWEQKIARCNVAQAFMTVFEDRGHKVVYLTFPDGQTVGFDVATGETHRRQSFGLDRWRMNTLTYWRGAWVAGDYSNGRLYQLDWAIQHEAGAEMERRRVFPVLHDNQNKVTVNAIEFVFDTGVAEAARPLLAPLSLAGDLPNGATGDAVSYTYTVGGGVLSIVASIASGALPTGLTMNAAGVVSGTLTAHGSFAWTVRATGADATFVDLQDSAEISTPTWLAWVNGTTLGTTGVVSSIGGESWPNPMVSMASLGLTGVFPAESAAALNGKAVFNSAIGAAHGGNPDNRYLTTSNLGVAFTDSDPGVTGSSAGTFHGSTVGGGYVFRAVCNAVVGEGVWRSADLSAWTFCALPAFAQADSLAYKGSRLLATATGQDFVYYSDNNGASWTKGVEDAFGGNNIEPYGICATPTRFIAAIPEAGAEKIMYSADGITAFTAATVTITSGDNPSAPCYGNGIIVVGCANATGKVYLSADDGSTFTLAATTLGGACSEVVYSAGVFVACTSNGRVLSSRDGNTWTLRYTDPNGFAIGALVAIL